jgi:hypothetical protein
MQQSEAEQAEALAAAAQAQAAERARRTHERLQLQDWESAYMKRLFPLIRSPRAAKRFVNVYRLLRGITSGERRGLLIGDEERGGYRSVLLLLAMVTGYPAETTTVIHELLERTKQPEPPEKWWALVDAVREEIRRPAEARAEPEANKATKPGKGRTPKQPKAHESSSNEEGPPSDDEARWEELFDKLKLLRTDLGEDFTCEDMSKWAPDVARYSFSSGRLLVGG